MTTTTTLTTLSDPLAESRSAAECISAPVLAQLVTFDGANESVPVGPTDESGPAPTPRDSGVFFGSADAPQEHTASKSPSAIVSAGKVQDPPSLPWMATQRSPAPQQDHAARERMFEVSTRSLLRSSTVVVPRDVAGPVPSAAPHHDVVGPAATHHPAEGNGAAAGSDRRSSLTRRDSTARPVSLSKILQTRRRGALTNVEAIPHAAGPQHPGSCLLSRHSTDILARFHAKTTSGRPAFFCRFDNLVVFDGVVRVGDGGEWRVLARSSKGLARANARGEEVRAEVGVECAHCRDMLGMRVWKYAARVCRRSVCGECRRRCVEMHEDALRAEKEAAAASRSEEEAHAPVIASPASSPVESPAPASLGVSIEAPGVKVQRGDLPQEEVIIDSKQADHPPSLDSIIQQSS